MRWESKANRYTWWCGNSGREQVMMRVLSLSLMLLVLASVSICVVPSTASDARGAAGGPFCGEPTLPVDEGSPVKARLGIEKRSVKSGGVLRVRIEDLGTTDLAYGFTYELARRKGGSWVKLPTRPVFAPRLVVRAGTASECQSIDIPRDANAGRYRIAKEVRPVGAGRGKQVSVRTTFRVQE
jgi:hypothetical protein